jgi:hypothetical protein
MDEQAAFEPRAVLAPSRARRSRLVLLVPAIALMSVALAGFIGQRTTETTAVVSSTAAPSGPAATGAPGPAVVPTQAPQRPATALGLAVHRLDDVRPGVHDPDQVVAIAGWYVATATTDCPPLLAKFRNGSASSTRGQADALAYCDRAGLLYGSHEPPDGRVFSSIPGEPIDVTVVIGVVMPPELELIGAAPTEVIVLGRFHESSYGCGIRPECRQVLVVDYIAWTPISGTRA